MKYLKKTSLATDGSADDVTLYSMDIQYEISKIISLATGVSADDVALYSINI